MPRPSLKEIRSEQILVAYAKCIYQFGFEGQHKRRLLKKQVSSAQSFATIWEIEMT